MKSKANNTEVVTKRAGKPTAIFAILYIAAVSTMLIGRNHFLFGSALIFARWFILLSGFMVLHSLLKKGGGRKLVVGVILVLILLTTESAWVGLNQTSPQQHDDGKQITMMSYNLFFLNKDPRSIMAIINKERPNLLVVQELTPSWQAYLRNSLVKPYRFRREIALTGTHGLGVYSHFPIKDVKTIENSSGLPVAQMVEITIRSRRILVVNSHLASPAAAVENPEKFYHYYNASYQQRRIQLTQINEFVAANLDRFDAVLLSGDLNTLPYEPIFRDLQTKWRNALHSVRGRSALNFPNSSRVPPIFTLDYILMRGSISAIDGRVIRGGSSDHQAILANLRLP